jgi:hypothetical protein
MSSLFFAAVRYCNLTASSIAGLEKPAALYDLWLLSDFLFRLIHKGPNWKFLLRKPDF